MPSTPSAEAARAPNPARTNRRREEPPATRCTRASKSSPSIVPPQIDRKTDRKNAYAWGWEPFIPRCHTFLLAGSPKTMSIIPTSVVCRCLVPLVSAHPHPAPRRGASPRARTHGAFGHISDTFPRRSRVRASRNTDAHSCGDRSHSGAEVGMSGTPSHPCGDDAEIVVGDACGRRADGKETSAWSCASTGQFFDRAICAGVANDRAGVAPSLYVMMLNLAFPPQERHRSDRLRVAEPHFPHAACRISVAISSTAQRRISGALTVPVPVNRRRRGRQ